MSDWQAGDLALCVSDREGISPLGFSTSCFGRLRPGRIYSVTGVGINPRSGSLCISLREAEALNPINGFAAWRFRKVTPPAADEFDRETIALMNGIRVGEPA